MLELGQNLDECDINMLQASPVACLYTPLTFRPVQYYHRDEKNSSHKSLAPNRLRYDTPLFSFPMIIQQSSSPVCFETSSEVYDLSSFPSDMLVVSELSNE